MIDQNKRKSSPFVSVDDTNQSTAFSPKNDLNDNYRQFSSMISNYAHVNEDQNSEILVASNHSTSKKLRNRPNF